MYRFHTHPPRKLPSSFVGLVLSEVGRVIDSGCSILHTSAPAALTVKSTRQIPSTHAQPVLRKRNRTPNGPTDFRQLTVH